MPFRMSAFGPPSRQPPEDWAHSLRDAELRDAELRLPAPGLATKPVVKRETLYVIRDLENDLLSVANWNRHREQPGIGLHATQVVLQLLGVRGGVVGDQHPAGAVPGERTSAKIRCSSSRTQSVPLGERFGVPSGHTVATKPSRCRSTSSFISSDNLGISTSHCPHGRPACCGHSIRGELSSCRELRVHHDEAQTETKRSRGAAE